MAKKRKPKFIAAFGYVKDKRDDRDFMYKASRPTLQALPPKTNNRPIAPTVLNQLDLGACVLHAGANAFRHAQKQSNVKNPIMPSRLAWYYETRRMEGTLRRDKGCEIRDAVKILASEGVCDEKLWVYNPANFRRQPPNECYKTAAQHQGLEYYRVPQQPSQIKARLSEGHPIMLGIQVYASFMSDKMALTGKGVMPDVKNEEQEGGHAVLLWDYDDTTGLYTIQNSWSTSWGDKGWFTLPYDFIHSTALTNDLWTLYRVE